MLPSPTVVFQFWLVFFFWILLTLTGEVIEDFLRNERGALDVTATPSEPIIQTEAVESQHLVNGGGKPFSRLNLPGRMRHPHSGLVKVFVEEKGGIFGPFKL
jgi:hypothetical protein